MNYRIHTISDIAPETGHEIVQMEKDGEVRMREIIIEVPDDFGNTLKPEKVIKGLTECVAAGLEKACPADCPYFLQCFPGVGLATPFVSLMADALTLLKEQGNQIEQLEHDLAVAQSNLNYYVNGND